MELNPGEIGFSFLLENSKIYTPTIESFGDRVDNNPFPIDLPLIQGNVKDYFASAWVAMPNTLEENFEHVVLEVVDLNGNVIHSVSPEVGKSANNWYLLELYATGLNMNSDYTFRCRLKNSALNDAYFDDFRVHPIDANMVNYVYSQQFDRITSIIDANNFYTDFIYDDLGRVYKTRKEVFGALGYKTISKKVLNYKK